MNNNYLCISAKICVLFNLIYGYFTPQIFDPVSCLQTAGSHVALGVCFRASPGPDQRDIAGLAYSGWCGHPHYRPFFPCRDSVHIEIFLVTCYGPLLPSVAGKTQGLDTTLSRSSGIRDIHHGLHGSSGRSFPYGLPCSDGGL